MSWLITLGILGILAALPLGVRLRYDEEGFFARILAGPMSFALYPFPKKDKKKKKNEKKTGKAGTGEAGEPSALPPSETAESRPPDGAGGSAGASGSGAPGAQIPPGNTGASLPGGTQKALPKPPQPPPAPKTKQGGSLTDFLPFVKLALNLGGDVLFRLLTFDRVYVRVVLCSGDKGALAVNYGKTWAALGNLLPLLDQRFRIKKRDIQVGCDFAGDQTRIAAAADIRVRLGGLLALAANYGVRGLIEFIKFKRKRKGGANK